MPLVTIAGQAFQDKHLRAEDVWLLKHAMCSPYWKTEHPKLSLKWTAHCDQDFGEDCVIQESEQDLPLASLLTTQIPLVLKSRELNVSLNRTGFILDDSKIPPSLNQQDFVDLLSMFGSVFESMGQNYEELFCKMYLMLVQNIIRCQVKVKDSRFIGTTKEIFVPSSLSVKDACSLSTCVINVTELTDEMINLIHRASMPWPSQEVRFENNAADFTTAVYLPSTNVEFVSLKMGAVKVAFDSPPIKLKPLDLWMRIAKCAEVLGASDDLFSAFKKMRGIAYFLFSLREVGLVGCVNKYTQPDELVLDVPAAYGINTLRKTEIAVCLRPTELMNTSLTLLLEVVESNHCWNRMHALIETHGLTVTDLYGKKIEDSPLFKSLCSDLWLTSDSDLSPLPRYIFGKEKIVQGQHKIVNILIKYTHFLKKNTILPYLRFISSYPITVEGTPLLAILNQLSI